MNSAPHEFPPSFGMLAYPTTQILEGRLDHIFLQAWKKKGATCEWMLLQASFSSPTFSNLPISSLISSLLGVVVSTDPSASTPGQRRRRCFPRRNVLGSSWGLNRTKAIVLLATSFQRDEMLTLQLVLQPAVRQYPRQWKWFESPGEGRNSE